jgi:integrase/recombinase XerD
MIHLIERFAEHLKEKKYNQATITAYRISIYVYYNAIRELPQSKITDEFIHDYLEELAAKKDRQEVFQTGKALKLFYEVIFNRKLRLKTNGVNKEEKLPDTLSKEEIKKLFSSVTNIKHKAVLLLIYNSGLRISEVLNIKTGDLNLENLTIDIWDKNREVKRTLAISPNITDYLKRYLIKEKPADILFPGEGGTPYSARNVQLFFQSALKKAGIEKEATVHTLRHSFAVHALEAGMDIHILQDILGHRFLQTTSIYNQVATIDISKMRNPIQDINLHEGELNFYPY